MGRRLLTALGSVAALCAAAPCTAGAGGRITPLPGHHQRQVMGPAIAGDALVYATPNAHDGFDLTHRNADGTTQTQHVTAAAGGRLGRYEDFDGAIAASPERVAFAVELTTCGDFTGCKYEDFSQLDSDVFSGPVGEPLPFDDCGGDLFNPTIDVSGAAIAYLDACAGGAVVRDFTASQRSPWRVFPADTDGDARIAGRFLAVDSGRVDPNDFHSDAKHTLTVYDWHSGDVVYEEPASGSAPFDIQDDGTLVSAGLMTGDGARLGWASPQDPSAHPLEGRPSATWVRIAGSKIATKAGDGFHVYDLGGSELAATPAADVRNVSGYDFDGQRMAWTDQPCAVTALVTWDLAGHAPTMPAGRCPAAAPAGRRGSLDLKHRRVNLPLRCPADPPLGCDGAWFARLNAKPPVLTGFAGATLDPGERGTLRLPLSVKVACRLARKPPTRATVDLTHPLSYDGRRSAQHRTARFDLRAIGRPRGCRQ
jgi:hypothetical protein